MQILPTSTVTDAGALSLTRMMRLVPRSAVVPTPM